MNTSRTWTQDEIKNLLLTNDQACTKALIRLFERQTDEEALNEQTVVLNSRGFNAFDAKILTSLARWILSGKLLTKRQIELIRKRIIKYTRQLTDIANQRV